MKEIRQLNLSLGKIDCAVCGVRWSLCLFVAPETVLPPPRSPI